MQALRHVGGMLAATLLPLAACVAPAPDTVLKEARPALGPRADDPPLETDPELLEAALVCPDHFLDEYREPVLLVHGTFTYGEENFSWNYRPWLEARGFDVCTVSYPDRGMGDQQIAAEYVVHAVNQIHRRSGRQVDMMGHSQGGSMPRWAIRWWPSVQKAVDDFVLIAPPSHGTQIAANATSSPFPVAPGFTQFDPSSEYVKAVNCGDETPGEIDYTVIYAWTDELVQPALPTPTAALDWGREEANTVNLSIQELCPGRPVDHVSIGTTDSAVAALVLDAFENEGPAQFERAGGSGLCLSLSFLNPATTPGALIAQGPDSFASFGASNYPTATGEPPLKPYAADHGCQ